MNERADRKAIFLEKRQHLLLIVQRFSFDVTNVVTKTVEMPFGRHSRINISQRACRSISSVFQRFVGVCVVSFKHGKSHNTLTLNLHAPLEWNLLRQCGDGLYLFGDRFSDDPVPARCASCQLSVFVSQVDRKPIEFIFKRKRRRGHTRCQLFYTCLPIGQRPLGSHLVHAPESSEMCMGLELRERSAANTPCRRIRQHDAAFFFELNKFVI